MFRSISCKALRDLKNKVFRSYELLIIHGGQEYEKHTTPFLKLVKPAALLLSMWMLQ